VPKSATATGLAQAICGFPTEDRASSSATWNILRSPLPKSTAAGPQRPWHEAAICEVHVGAASEEGTLRALTNKLDHFRDAVFTDLEIMPVNESPRGSQLRL